MFTDMIRNKIENNEIASYSEAVEFGAVVDEILGR